MPQEGLSVVVADKILDAIYNNIPLAFGLATLGLYTGSPGTDGTANVFGGTTRQALTCSLGSSGATSGSGALPKFTVTSAGTVAKAATWNGYEADMSSVMIQSGRLLVPQTVAIGDVINVNSITIEWNASDLAAT